MAILNNTLCDKCRAFDRCDEQYGEGVPPSGVTQTLGHYDSGHFGFLNLLEVRQ